MERQTHLPSTVKSGITFGSALAMVISYTTWHSVGWHLPRPAELGVCAVLRHPLLIRQKKRGPPTMGSPRFL